MDNKTIQVGSWFGIYTEPVIEIDEGVRLDVKIPRNHDTSLPVIDSIDGYTISTLENNYDYFASLLDNEVKIFSIEGENLTENGRLHHDCDYCGTNVDIKGYPIRSCSECKKSMCALCWEEKTEEIARKHGAKNWHNRKDELMTCFSHVDKITISRELPINCNVCGKSSRDIYGRWNCNRDQDKDICPSCFYTERGQAFLNNEEGKWNVIQYKNDWPSSRFGSMLDWVILLEDEDEYDYVLYNINKESVNYHRIALVAVDDQDRHKFYIVPGTIEDILVKLRRDKIVTILSELHFA